MKNPACSFFAVTLGDPCGIGPEITARLIAQMPEAWKNHLIFVGSASILRDALRQLGHTDVPFAAAFASNSRGIMVMDTGTGESAKPGLVCEFGGRESLSALKAAHDLCSQRMCRGIITGPIGKKAIRLAGSPFSGHTDMLEAWTHAAATRMAMVYGKFRVVMSTLHVPYRSVPVLLTQECVYETLRLAHESFRTSRRPLPRIAVAGLNPHAGEDGLFGQEERDSIVPAMNQFKAVNPNLSGPFPADSLYKREMRRSHDVFVAHTHDQGLIAIKTLGGLACVNVTLGLPYLRTSVGHGTAYDIAGKGIADASGLFAACREAFRLAGVTPRIGNL